MVGRLFGDRLKLALELRDPSYHQLRTAFGTSRFDDSLSRYMAGEAMPQLDRLVALCVLLNVSADWLLGIDVIAPECYHAPAPDE